MHPQRSMAKAMRPPLRRSRAGSCFRSRASSASSPAALPCVPIRHRRKLPDGNRLFNTGQNRPQGLGDSRVHGGKAAAKGGLRGPRLAVLRSAARLLPMGTPGEREARGKVAVSCRNRGLLSPHPNPDATRCTGLDTAWRDVVACPGDDRRVVPWPRLVGEGGVPFRFGKEAHRAFGCRMRAELGDGVARNPPTRRRARIAGGVPGTLISERRNVDPPGGVRAFLPHSPGQRSGQNAPLPRPGATEP